MANDPKGEDTDKREQQLKGTNADRARVNAQCFLMENIEDLRHHVEGGQNHFRNMVGDPMLIKEKLLSVPGLKDFMQLKPNQLSALIPFVDIYLEEGDMAIIKATGRNHGAKNRTQVYFEGMLDRSNIEELFSGKGAARVGGAGLKEFSYEADGGQAGGNSQETKASGTAKLVFAAPTLSAFGQDGGTGMKSIFDLARQPMPPTQMVDGAKVAANPKNYVIKLVYGWAVSPRAEKELGFSSMQLNAIDGSTRSMKLFQNDQPKFTMQEDGSVELELNFYSKLEIGTANGFEIDVYSSPRESNQLGGVSDANQKNKAELNAMLAKMKSTVNLEHKDLAGKFGSGDWNADNEELMTLLMDEEDGYHTWQTEEYDKSDSVGNAGKSKGKAKGTKGVDTAYKDNEYLKSVDGKGTHGHFDDTDDFIAFADKFKNQSEGFKKSETKFQDIVDEARMQKWSRHLNTLFSNNKIHTLMVPREMLGITDEGNVDDRKRPPQTLTEEEQAKLKTENPEQYAAWQKAKNDHGDEWETPEEAAKKRQEVAKKQHQKDHGSGGAVKNNDERVKAEVSNARDPEKDVVVDDRGYSSWRDLDRNTGTKKMKASDRLTQMEHSTGYIPVSADGSTAKLHYFYLGDLLEVVFSWSDIHFAKKDRGGPTPQPGYILGTLEYDPVQGGVRRRIPLAEIPIAMEMYTAWMRTYIIGPQKIAMGLKEWLDLLLQRLIIPCFGGGLLGCAGPPATETSGNTQLQYEAFTAPGTAGPGSKCRILQAEIEIPFLGVKTGYISPHKIPSLKSRGSSRDSRNRIPHQKEYSYVLMHAVTRQTNSLRGKSAIEDDKAGIYWLGMGYDEGPVKSTSFERIEDETFRSVWASNASKTAGGSDPLMGMSVPQQAEIKMHGNSLIGLGSTFFVDVASAGSIEDWQIANQLGFGGYYMCINLHGVINDAGWECTVTGYPMITPRSRRRQQEKIALDSAPSKNTETTTGPDAAALAAQVAKDAARVKAKKKPKWKTKIGSKKVHL